MLGIIYIPVLVMFMTILRGSKNGQFIIWYVIICGWVTDIFAYLAGKIFGEKKHKFSKISPNKSIEGCIIGTLGAMIVSIIFTIIGNMYFYMNISYIYIVIVSLVLSAVGQVGDFAASSIKRYNNIKDFSNLIPGHRRIVR